MWTGDEMIVWGGIAGASPLSYLDTGGKYNRTTNNFGLLLLRPTRPRADFGTPQ
ncbi:MAG TPA: hypothetical protein VGK91_07325 [Candidatus Udaeobacter sp.]